MFSGGVELVNDRRHAFGTVVSNGGFVFITGSTLEDLPFLLDFGIATSLTISSGGSAVNRGVSSDTTIGAGGTFELLSLGTVSGTTVIEAGGLLKVGADDTLTTA